VRTNVTTTVTSQIDPETMEVEHEVVVRHLDGVLPPPAMYAAVIGACRTVISQIPEEFRIETDLLMRFEAIANGECQGGVRGQSCIEAGWSPGVFDDHACTRCRIRKVVDDWAAEQE
jgi:hypothetical protein